MIPRLSWAIQILGYILTGLFVLPRLMYLFYNLYTPASRGSLGQEGAYKNIFRVPFRRGTCLFLASTDSINGYECCTDRRCAVLADVGADVGFNIHWCMTFWVG